MKTADLFRLSDSIGALILAVAAFVIGMCGATAWFIWRAA